MNSKFALTLILGLALSACARSAHDNSTTFGTGNKPREAVYIPHTGTRGGSTEIAPPEAASRAPVAPVSPAAPPRVESPIPPANQTAPSKPDRTNPAPVREPVRTADTPPGAPEYFQISEQPPHLELTNGEIAALNLPEDPETETRVPPNEEIIPQMPAPARVEAAPAAPRVNQASLPERPLPAASAPSRRESLPAPRPAATDATGLETQLLNMINAARAKAGVAPLKFSRAQSKGNGSCMGSKGHAEFMAQHQRLSHENFPRNICLRSGAQAENVGYATGDEQGALKRVHQSFVTSPGHYQNLMNPQYNIVGLGFFITRTPFG